MKKPETLEIQSADAVLCYYKSFDYDFADHVNFDVNTTFYSDIKGDSKNMRRIAKWLLKAADYLDFRAGVK